MVIGTHTSFGELVTVSVDSSELKLVLDRLENVKLELLRLRSILAPEEEAMEQEKKEIKKARAEILRLKMT